MKVHASIIAGLASIGVLAIASTPSKTYTAHEWGTFTSVQGADGVQMNWNPLTAAELPKFVHDISQGSVPWQLVLGKTGLFARQRLETPVIYFHSDSPLTVSVDVAFPHGNVTEWYPRAVRPSTAKPGKSGISWPGLAIIPRQSPEAAELESSLPKEETGSHYYAAREAEADFVRVSGQGAAEVEKFLFYRGVGDFTAPLQVTMPNPERPELRLENAGTEALRGLVVLRVGEGFMTITSIGDLAPKSSTVASIGSPVAIDEGRQQLGAILREAVARAGLTPTEAAAMVKTWDESWFTERGVRVLYVLPRGWADSVLPLALKPAPSQLQRVFVGRAEVITPAVEKALADEIDHARIDDPIIREEAVKNIRALGLGRFLEPAFRRVSSQHPEDRLFSTLGWELLQAANQPAPKITQR